MTNYDVVKKIIGPVRPLGDASKDYEILDNLKKLCELHQEIHLAIEAVVYDFKDNQQGSIKACCEYASKYLDSLSINE